jgi:Ala-tRNA(Pro) deacylase
MNSFAGSGAEARYSNRGPVDHESRPGIAASSRFLRSRDRRLRILVTAADRRPDLRLLAEILGEGRLTFGSPDLLLCRLGVVPGAVTPFAVVNDLEGLVNVVVDRALLDFDALNFHPLDNSMTTAISPDDLLRFLESAGHTPTIAAVEYD